MTAPESALIGMASRGSLCRASRQVGPGHRPTGYRVYARRGTRTLNAMKTTAFEAAAFANFAMRAKKPRCLGTVGWPAGNLRALYARPSNLSIRNKRSPRENRMAFARLWRLSSSPLAHSARFSTQPPGVHGALFEASAPWPSC